MSTLILTAVLAAGVLPILVRDLKRADELRRCREFAQRHQVGAALLPTVMRAAADAERAMRQINKTMMGVNPDALTALTRAAKQMQRNAKQ